MGASSRSASAPARAVASPSTSAGRGQRVLDDIGLPVAQRRPFECRDRGAVLRVHGDETTLAARHAQHVDDDVVVDLQRVGIGHVELERGDPLLDARRRPRPRRDGRPASCGTRSRWPLPRPGCATRPTRRRGAWPRRVVTYSITVVVPPTAPAAVPEPKSSLTSAAPTCRCRWVWASTPPGMTSRPAAGDDLLAPPRREPGTDLGHPAVGRRGGRRRPARRRRSTTVPPAISTPRPARCRWH